MSGICSAHIEWQVGCDICEASTPPLAAIRSRAKMLAPGRPAADGRHWDAVTQAVADRDALLDMVLHARAVAIIWRDAYLANIEREGTMPWAVGTHPLSLVLGALDGETDPRELGVDPEVLSAVLRKEGRAPTT